jgi:hypothetical protein
MKCPKCNYVSHDYLDACRKCGVDLVDFKMEIGLAVLQPGVLDLGLILGDLGTDDLFAGIDEEVTMHAGDDDDFDISLDDHLESPAIRRGAPSPVHSGGGNTGDDIAGMDHLTLELDSLDVPPELAAQLRALRTPADGVPIPPVPVVPAALRPGAITLPGHLTVEMDPGNLSTKLPASLFQEPSESSPPPPQDAPQVVTSSAPPSNSLELDLSQMHLPSGMTALPSENETTSTQPEQDTMRMDSSGSIPSLSLDDVILVDEASGAAAIEDDGSALFDEATKTFDELATRRALGGSPTDAEESIPFDVDMPLSDTVTPDREAEGSAPPAVDAGGPLQAEAASTMAAVGGESLLEEMDILPSFEFEMRSMETDEGDEEAYLSRMTFNREPPSLDQPAAPLVPPGPMVPFTPIEPPDTDADELTSSDMFALSKLADPERSGRLTIEVHSPTLTDDMAERLYEDAARTPSNIPTTAELLAGTNLISPPPRSESGTLPEMDDDVERSGHLTLELDVSEVQEETSSLIMETLQRENPAGSTPASKPPSERREDDTDELLLDLDRLTLDEEEPQ